MYIYIKGSGFPKEAEWMRPQACFEIYVASSIFLARPRFYNSVRACTGLEEGKKDTEEPVAGAVEVGPRQ